MRKVSWFLTGVFTLAGLLPLVGGLGFGTTLDHFEIKTDKNAVKVILHTDNRANFTTEGGEHQFAIILNNTQLAPSQVQNGLPIVIDNQNKFIGRAVPLSDGRVKIVLPNLPANQYAISVLQTSAGTSASKQPPASRHTNPLKKPKQSVDMTAQAAKVKPVSAASVEEAHPVALTAISDEDMSHPFPMRMHSRHKANQSFVSVSSKTPMARRFESTPQATVNYTGRKGRLTLNTPPEPPRQSDAISALAVDSAKAAEAKKAATESTSSSSAVIPVQQASPAAIPAQSNASWLGQMQQSLPLWGILVGSLGLIGLGLVLIAGLVLILKRGAQPQLEPSSFRRSGSPSVLPFPGRNMDEPLMESPIGNSAMSSEQSIRFEDTVRIKGTEYLMTPPQSVSEAVQNTLLLKFPARQGALRSPKKVGV